MSALRRLIVRVPTVFACVMLVITYYAFRAAEPHLPQLDSFWTWLTGAIVVVGTLVGCARVVRHAERVESEGRSARG